MILALFRRSCKHDNNNAAPAEQERQLLALQVRVGEAAHAQQKRLLQ